MKKLLYIASIAIFFSCETTIFPELNEAEEILVIDAWLNNNLETQEIKITRSQPYFDSTFPAKVSGATVVVEDMNTGETYNFVEGADSYTWTPGATPLGVIDNIYRLTVTVDGETFEAYSDLGAVPPIDSIKFSWNEEDAFITQDYYTAEFVSTDLIGEGNTYWIKSYKNGVFLSKPDEINIAYDAGFSAGGAVDGQVFIQPIQDGANPFDEDPENDGEFLPPYVIGDSVYVEIHSINLFAFNFLQEVAIQTNRPGGFSELFATPLANVSTNFSSTTENSPTNIGGFFNIASISSRGGRLSQELADMAREAEQ